LPSLRAAYIPPEVAIAILLLKMSPHDIVHDMKAEYWRGLNKEGNETVERIYTDWCSSKYACEAQRLIREGQDSQWSPLILYASIFVDGGVMNSSQSRSATPVSIAIQNVRKEKYQALIGFVPSECNVSKEVLEGLLDAQGVNKTNRAFILQHTSRQRARMGLLVRDIHAFYGKTT
jgi:hypothetical protein